MNNIKTITTSTGTYMFVTVPKDAKFLYLRYNEINDCLDLGYDTKSGTSITALAYDFNGQYSILGTVRFEAGEVKLQGFGTNYKEIYAIEERVRNKTFPFYWVNPLGEKPDLFKDRKYLNETTDKHSYKWDDFKEDIKAWRAAEDLKLKDDQAVVVIKVEEKC